MPDPEFDTLLARLARANPVLPRDVSGAAFSARADAIFEGVIAGTIQPTRLPLGMRKRAWQKLGGLRAGDELERLVGALNPYRQSEIAGAGQSLRAEMLFDRIVAGTEQSKPVRIPHGSRRRVALAMVVAAAFVGSAAGYVLAQRHVSNAYVVGCYRSDSLSGKPAVLIPGAIPATTACLTQVWEKGTFGHPSQPALVACVLPSGVQGVFPGRGDAVCTKLGLSAALSPTKLAETETALQGLLSTTLTPQHCVSLSPGKALVQRDLNRFGLGGTAIVVLPGFSSSRPCVTATEVQQSSTMVVQLAPLAPAPAPGSTGASG